MGLSGSSKGFLAVLLIGALVVGVGLSRLRTDEAAGAEGPVTVVIPEGVGTSQVADILEEQGVIGSAFAFTVRARFDDRSSRIRPGTYQLEPGVGTSQILAQISAAPDAAPAFTVTIPEGLTVDQTLERIAEAEGSPHTVEQLRAALPSVTLPAWVPPGESIPQPAPYEFTRYEGVLFPDTYEFRVDAPAQEVLARLVERTGEVMEEVGVPEPERYRTLVIASLIEREARLREEQATISSVIANRLAEPMRLQIDASALYATGQSANTVTREDTERDSPWNTYRVDGLPPTPISGAGASAIQAAAQPATTDFRYYVVSDPDTGAHAFASTLEEHNANVAEYRAQRDG